MATYAQTELACLKRVEVLRDVLADQNLLDEPCPLMASRLNELIVLAEKMTSHARSLLRATEHHLSAQDPTT